MLHGILIVAILYAVYNEYKRGKLSSLITELESKLTSVASTVTADVKKAL